jgi:23S rRNA G2445 N2-methylase RlmL
MAEYHGALVTYPGFEGITAAEVKELIGARATAAAEGIVTFKIKDLTDLCRLCYLSQSASSVLFPEAELRNSSLNSSYLSRKA